MSANSRMITNPYSECWWLALFFLTHWLTLCFMPAVRRTHTPLSWSCNPSSRNHRLRWIIKGENQWKQIKWASQEGFQDLGREMLLTTRWNDEQKELLISNWVDHILQKKACKTNYDLILNIIKAQCCTSQAKFTSSEAVFLSLPVCCVVNPCRWVPGLLSPQATQTSIPLLTYFGVDTNSGEAVKAHLLLLLTSVFFLTETSWCL